MSLSDLSIDRPVLTWMMTLALATFGILGLTRLGIDRYPDMTMPFVGVVVTMESASPTTMEDEIVDPLEEAFATIEGIHHTYSTSAQGMARIMMEFELDYDVDIAAQDVRDKIARARYELPIELEPPVVDKMNPNDHEILWVPLNSDRPAVEVSEYIRRNVKPRLETIDGVASVPVFGRVDRNIRIWLGCQHQINKEVA